MDVKQIWPLIKQSVTSWVDDYAPSMGAALSYYTLFSIAPLLLIVIAVAGFVFGDEAARGEIFAQLQSLLGEEGAAAVQGLLKSASQPAESAFAAVIGIVTLIIGATTVFGELQSALDRIWRAPARPESTGIWSLLRARFLSFGMVLGIGFLLIVSLVMSAALAALGKWWGGWFEGWEVLLQVLNFVVSFAIVTVVFAMIYKIMPRVKISWHDVWIGAIVTSALFTLGKFLIGLYIGKSGVASGFGAAGSMVVLLIWVYYSAQIFLLGAEFTWVYAHEYGSLKGQEKPEPTAPTQSEESSAKGVEQNKPKPVKSSEEELIGRPEPVNRPRWLDAVVPSRGLSHQQRSPLMNMGFALAAGWLVGEMLKPSNRQRIADLKRRFL